MNRCNAPEHSIDEEIRGILAANGRIVLALLFGSMAGPGARSDSDVDIAVAADRVLGAGEKLALIGRLAERLGRPIDLIDLRSAGEPLLGEIIRHGRRVLGTDTAYARLLSKHLFDQADFLPYRTRILAERRRAWIGSGNPGQTTVSEGNRGLSRVSRIAAPLPAPNRGKAPA